MIMVRLLNSILSKPMKADCETVKNDPARMVSDAISMRFFISGL